MIELYLLLAITALLVSLLPSQWPRVVRFWRDVSGTATVTYGWPVPTGTTGFVTTPPTAANSANTKVVLAQIAWVDADTAATVTHNWGMNVTFTFPFPNTAQNLPEVILNYIAYQTGAPAALSVSAFNSNNIVVSKTNLASTAGTVSVVMRLPMAMAG